MGDAARLEKALLRWTMTHLIRNHDFVPVMVPNLIYDDIIKSCGFEPHARRTQVYSIDGSFSNDSKPMSDVLNTTINADGSHKKRMICLSGTSEIPLVSMHVGKTFDVDSVGHSSKSDHLPKKYIAMSRCYRAEASNVEKGLYRVHYFNKVEMLALVRSTDGESDSMMRKFVKIQEELFSLLGLQYKVVDIPKEELGPVAKTKIDIEAYFPGRDIFGEISSASDCIDNQCKNLNIRYRRLATEGELHGLQEHEKEPFVTSFAHSVNGTAAATPRLLLPLIETHQQPDGWIRIPDVLQSYMDGQSFIEPLSI